MQKIIVLIIVFTAALINVSAQSSSHKNYRARLSEETVVRDTAGHIIPYVIWKRLSASGESYLKPVNSGDPDSDFIMHIFSEREQAIRDSFLLTHTPQQSRFFRTGEKFSKIKTTDIYDNEINTKDLKGKIIVLNYWFTACAPCRSEIPELNKIADSYKNDSDIVFIAIATDDAIAVTDFLKQIPFRYNLIAAGRQYTDAYRINSFPTNVIVDKNGKVCFHTSGFSIAVPFWIRKTIEALKAGTPPPVN